jgi:2-desacetyl-2-hydroxyethyl bacteriochlorophyllide A dehydrogenase
MNRTMQGAVLHGAKDLRLEQCAVPELRPGQILLRVRRAGICGSDLHYYRDGYCAAFVPTRPFILGHEAVAQVAAVADDVKGLTVGTRVVVNPARACGFCDFCKNGRGNLCQSTVFLGSASTKPPTDGLFAEFAVVRADQCFVVPSQLDDGLAALMEPLAVALHAVRRAGTVSGKSVLVLGAGPIGTLVLITARAYGAGPVAVTEIVPARRKKALEFGAEAALDPTAAPFVQQARDLGGKGCDIIFEASGSPAALRQGFELVRPGGSIVQIGTLGTEDIPLPANQVMVSEAQYIGSFRYGNVFGEAIRLAASGRVDLRPLVSEILPMNQVTDAMTLASIKERVLKVQLEMR